MITFIRGELAEVKENYIILDNQGMGYEIFVPQTVIEDLPRIGDIVKIHTYMQVREDAFALFGFLRKEDLMVFKLLISVNGIGPKGAVGILGAISADDLRFAILAEDAKTIAKAPGIGAKTASKLILELKDKFKLDDAFESKLEKQSMESSLRTQVDGIRNEAVQALVALGYSGTDAMKAVKQVEIKEDMTTDELLKQSLRHMGM